MKDADAIVFVVDDDLSIREAIQSLVRLEGLRVETFATAQDFLRRELVPISPGCVVLDVELPGLSGLDLRCANWPRNGITLPIIFLSLVTATSRCRCAR